MTEHDTPATPGAAESSPAISAGALLAEAREAAGLSIDTVAQQLKLAPRQVIAIEEGDYTQLPGRTFIRGFIRNYARLLNLDAERVLGALPAGTEAPMLESPTLHPTAPTIGELPTTDHSKPNWTRWSIPLTLIAIAVAAGVYEWLRPATNGHATSARESAPVAERAGPPAAPQVEKTTAAPPVATVPAPEKSDTPLANPLAGGASPADASAAAASASSPAAPAPAVEQQELVLTFRDNSWTEVRDRDGHVLLSRMNAAGSTQSLSGTPPLDVVIGNASDVELIYKGQPVNLVPYTRGNVARLALP